MLRVRRLVLTILFILPATVSAVDWQQPKLVSNVWKISKAGQPDSYLLGTIHVGRERAALSQDGRDLMAKSDKLVTEVDMQPSTAEEVRQAGVLIFKMAAKKPLRQLLGGQDFTRLQQLFARRKETRNLADSIDGLKPWAVVMLSSNVLPEGYSGSTGVDVLMTKYAMQNGKRRGSLERMDDSLAAFEKLPDGLSLSLLRSGIKYNDENEEDIRLLHSAYEKGRYADLPERMRLSVHTGRLSAKDEKAVANWMVEDVMVARNRAWLPKIKAESAKQRTLFAVGIAHLMTERGLIAELRKEGYSVTPERKRLMW